MKETTLALPPEIKELRIPAALFDTEKYPHITRTSMLLYAVLLALPKCVDKNGKEYIEMSTGDIKKIMGCRDTTFRTNFTYLKDYGLVETYKPRFASVMRYVVKEVA